MIYLFMLATKPITDCRDLLVSWCTSTPTAIKCFCSSAVKDHYYYSGYSDAIKLATFSKQRGVIGTL